MLRSIQWRILRWSKTVLRQLFSNKDESPVSIFVLGCQRSGTTLLMDIFERDFRTIVFRERSRLFSEAHPLRLKPLEQVNGIMQESESTIIVAKPLLDSQNCRVLIDSIPRLKIVWIFRNYRDVARSNLKLFGLENGIRDISPVALGEFSDWKAEKLSQTTVDLIKSYYSSDMNPYDAAALFWYIRNIIFFENELHNSHDVTLCKYEDLVSYPLESVTRIYQFIGIDMPKPRVVNGVFSSSIAKGANLDISPEIETLCEGLLSRMTMHYQNTRAEGKVS